MVLAFVLMEHMRIRPTALAKVVQSSRIAWPALMLLLARLARLDTKSTARLDSAMYSLAL